MQTRLWLIMFIGLLGISFGAPLARFLPDLPAISIAFWRLTVATLALWLLSFARRDAAVLAKPDGRIIPAGFLLAVHFLTFYGALKYAPVAQVTLLVALAPLFAMLIERFYLQRRVSLQLLLGLILALCGAVIVQGFNLDLSDERSLGSLLALGSALCWAGVLLMGERVRVRTGAIAYTRWLYLVAGVVIGSILLITGESIRFQSSDLIWVLALGFLPTLIGHTSLNYAVKFLRPTVVGTASTAEPILASMLAWMLFGEIITAQLAIGGVLVIGSLVLISLSRDRSIQGP
jgi:drug/metabolite transporter (DMT)-like permease